MNCRGQFIIVSAMVIVLLLGSIYKAVLKNPPTINVKICYSTGTGAANISHYAEKQLFENGQTLFTAKRCRYTSQCSDLNSLLLQSNSCTTRIPHRYLALIPKMTFYLLGQLNFPGKIGMFPRHWDFLEKSHIKTLIGMHYVDSCVILAAKSKNSLTFSQSCTDFPENWLFFGKARFLGKIPIFRRKSSGPRKTEVIFSGAKNLPLIAHYTIIKSKKEKKTCWPV